MSGQDNEPTEVKTEFSENKELCAMSQITRILANEFTVSEKRRILHWCIDKNEEASQINGPAFAGAIGRSQL